MFAEKKIGLLALASGVGMLALTAGGPTPAQAETLTVVSYGGSFQAAQRKVYFEPFAKDTGVTVREDEWSDNLAAIETQVRAGKVTWDVIAMGTGGIDKACNEGLIEPLDISMLGGTDRFVQGAVHKCGVRSMISCNMSSFNAEAFPNDKQPSRLTDFFDVKNFPGKRGLNKGHRHTMPLALLADGVPPHMVYDVLGTEEGIARAFRKLDEIKPNVVWWTAWGSPGQLLADGEVTMTQTASARIVAAAKDFGKPLKLIWDGASNAGDYWVVVKDTPNKELAMKFIQYAFRDDRQIEWAHTFAYGPTVKAALAKVPDEIGKNLCTHPHNQTNAFVQNPQFWADHDDEFAVRFNAWLAK